MRRLIPIFVIMAACGLAGIGQRMALAADTGAPAKLRFAVVDMQQVLRHAEAIRSIRPQMDKLKETYQKKFKKYEEDLKAQNQDLQRQRAILSPDAYADRQRSFKKLVNERQREVQTVRRMLDQAGGLALRKVHRAFYEVTAEVAKERSLTLVMRKSGLLFVNPAYDISAEVLKRLDKRLPKVVVKLPKPDGAQQDEKPQKN